MKIGTKLYFNNVIKELNNIKKYATEKEINKLNFEKLYPTSSYDCIYGQMTGSCFSSRANELIKLCVKTKTSFSDIFGTIIYNNKPRENKYNYFTYLEHCISKYEHNNKNIINYLKGNIDTIILTSKP